MKPSTCIWIAAVLLGLAVLSSAQNTSTQSPNAQYPSAQEQPLGNYARAMRKDKKPAAAKQFDNDNLPREDKISVVGPAPEQADASATTQDAAQPSQPTEAEKANAAHIAKSKDKSQITDASASTAGDTKPADDDNKKSEKAGAKTAPAKDQQQQTTNAQWQDKIDTQKEQIDLLAREMDVLQREYRLRQVAMYADAGNRLRNSGSWDKEDTQYKEQIADKQKALQDAKQRLEDLNEDARKAGVKPNSSE